MAFFDKLIRRYYRLWPGVLLAALGLMTNSCNTTKYLEEGQQLLVKNTISVEGKLKNRRDNTYQLSTLYKQVPNSNFLFIPREWFYYRTQDPNDTTSLDRWQRRVLGEKPVIYNDSLTRATADAMSLYLQRRGYFNAEVLPIVKDRGKKVNVNYYVFPRDPFLIDSVHYSSRDERIDDILQNIAPNSPFEAGEILDLRLFDLDKERITSYLRNNGYAYFYGNYFDQLVIDTNLFNKPKYANLYVEVFPPYADSAHTAYRIGRVNIFTDFNPDSTLQSWRDTLIGRFHYYLPPGGFRVNPSTLADAIFLLPGAVYSQEDFDRTNQQLNALGTYRFVRIKQEVDTLQPGVLNFNIQLTSNYRLEVGVDFELNYTNRSTAGAGNLIGVSLNPSLRNRNLFGGAELLVTNLSAGVEINPSFRGARFWNTVDLAIQNDLYFPKFIDYLHLWRGIYNIPVGRDKHLLNTEFYRTLLDNTATRLSVSYNYLDILNWYSYNLFNASFGYDFQRSKNTRYLINHIGIDYLNPVIQPPFQEVLDQNLFLKNSFGQQVFVSLLFRNLDYLHTSRINQYGWSTYGNFNVELAGAEIWAANAIYNELAAETTPRVFRLGNGTNFSQYVRTEIDLRAYKQYTANRSLALRFNFGIARPFGFTTDVPYVKQFFAGGPNSLRAWAPRELGPGGYRDTTNTTNRLRLYQSGDIKLETNVELRFDIFWLLKGALFLDVGNVWTYHRDADRCGSQFQWGKTVYPCGGEEFVHYPFYRQLAVGGGLGFRVDLSYFIFRLDLATKLRNNFPRSREGKVTEGDWWVDFRQFQFPKDLVLNLGLGYPF